MWRRIESVAGCDTVDQINLLRSDTTLIEHVSCSLILGRQVVKEGWIGGQNIIEK